jgi:hypothetical protein
MDMDAPALIVLAICGLILVAALTLVFGAKSSVIRAPGDCFGVWWIPAWKRD